MKKVLLVDDEILVRESIRACIQWEREGFIYCGDAADGELALPLIEELQPDILITDIKMPFMDGLELSAIVRKQMPEMKIIIMSGHDEFEYARAALRVGVQDYCLKPVSSEDIVKLLREVSDTIDRERTERELMQRLSQASAELTIDRRLKLLSDLCCGFISTAEAIHTADSLKLELVAPCYAVAITGIRSQDGSKHVDPNLVHYAEQFVGEQLSQLTDYFSYKRSATETVWLLKGSQQALEAALKLLSGDELQMGNKQRLFHMSVGLGQIQSRLQSIHLSYLEAEDNKHWRQISQELYRNAATEASSFPPADRQRFIEFLKLGSMKQTPAFVDSLSDSLLLIDWRGSFYGTYLLNELTFEAMYAAKGLYRLVLDDDALWGQLQKEIADVSCAKTAAMYLSRLLQQYWQWRMEATGKYADLISEVKRYVLKHYANDRLSLQDVADHVNVSASHLSKVFSQQSEQTFIEYLTQTRIRKAQELLQTSNARSYEIAHQVGYNDSHYFSNLFKRITGMTTTQYRKQLHQDNWQQSGGA